MKLKKYRNNKIGNYFGVQIIIMVLSFCLSLVVINRFAKKINEVVMPLAVSEVRKHVTNMINISTKNISFSNKLFDTEKNNKNEIILVSYDSYEATKLINEITNNIQDNMDRYTNDYVISKIPLGIIFENAFLRNMGPMISVRMMIIGDILSELETEVKPYGINNALIEVRVKVRVVVRVILPVTSKEVKINNIIPISINVISGSVPDGYITTYK
jgi:sporulation protein YunB